MKGKTFFKAIINLLSEFQSFLKRAYLTFFMLLFLSKFRSYFFPTHSSSFLWRGVWQHNVWFVWVKNDLTFTVCKGQHRLGCLSYQFVSVLAYWEYAIALHFLFSYNLSFSIHFISLFLFYFIYMSVFK